MSAEASCHEDSRWAPWWAYAVSFLVLNYLRQVLIPPGDVSVAANIALFAAVAAIVAVAVTVVHNGLRPGARLSRRAPR